MPKVTDSSYPVITTIASTDYLIVVDDPSGTPTVKRAAVSDVVTNIDTSDITSGTFADARIAASNVTQHQGSIDHGSVAGLGDDDHTIYVLADGTRALTGDWSAGSNKITNLATPTADGDAASKSYVDSVAAGLDWKESVRVATAAAGTLATSFENGDTVDGVVLATGDRILLKNQATGSENGIYVVAASGAPSRATDLAAGDSAAGVVVFAEEGSNNADTSWVCTNDGGSDVVGTDALTFASFSGGTTDHGSLTGLGDDDHTIYLLASGTRPLAANWDAGAVEIRAETFQSDVTTGTAPFTVASTTVVTNLNADQLDGNHASAFATASHTHNASTDITIGTLPHERGGLEADVSAFRGFPFINTGATFEFRINTAGTAAPTATDDSSAGYRPGAIWVDTTGDKAYVCVDNTTSAAIWKETTAVGDLKADGTVPLTANWDVGSFQIRAQTFQSDVTTGTAPLTIASTTVVTNLNADQVDGIHGTDLVKRDGTTALTANWDVGSFQIRAQTFQSDVTSGTAPLTIASTTVCTNLNADLLDGNHASAFATASHTHAASAITSGTLAHERGGLEFNASAVAIGDIIAGSATGTMALVTSTGHTEGDLLTRQSDGSVDYEAPPLTNSICDGRLTTETGVPISDSDRTSQSTIYFTPYKGNRIALYNGTVWKIHTFTERPLTLSSLTSGKNYDVFLYDNSGTLTLELSAAWTNDTTRADAITLQDGVYVKSSSTTRRLLGTIRTTGTTTTEDSRDHRYVWNLYNQKSRPVKQDAAGTTASYSTSATYRAAGGDSNVRSQVVCGLAAYSRITLHGAANAACASVQAGHVGIGEDSTTSANSDFFNDRTFHNSSVDVDGDGAQCHGSTPVPLGYHYYQLLEYQETTNSTSWSNQMLRGDYEC